MSNFTIQIHGGFLTWEYPLHLSDDHSIQEIANVIFNYYGLKEEEGNIVENKTIIMLDSQRSDN